MNKDRGRGVSRRAFVGKLTTGAAGAAVAVSLARSASALSSVGKGAADASADVLGETSAVSGGDKFDAPISATTTAAPPPWHLLLPLRAGTTLTSEWSVVDLSGIVGGACVLTLGNRHGREHRVHICRNGGTPQGLVYTEKFDLVVMNGGRGDLPTEEDLGHAVAAVAHAIAANEVRDVEIAGLLPQTEREERFGAAAHLR